MTLPRPTPPLLHGLLGPDADWLDRDQPRVFVCLRNENRVLRRHLWLTETATDGAEHVRMAVRGRALGERVFDGSASIVTPEAMTS
jgi:hypothetical protein